MSLASVCGVRGDEKMLRRRREGESKRERERERERERIESGKDLFAEVCVGQSAWDR